MRDPKTEAISAAVPTDEASIRDALDRFIHGRSTMSIPVQPHDADLIISKAIDELVELRKFQDVCSLERGQAFGQVEDLQRDITTLTRERDEARAEVERIRATLAGEGEAKECWCQWEVGDSPCPTHGMDEEKGARAALAGEGEGASDASDA